MDLAGNSFVNWRRYRQRAKEIVDDVPNLFSALQEYRRNLNALVDIGQSHGIRLVFVTQPAIWRSNMKQDETDLLWLGGVDSFQLGKGNKYYSPASLAKAISQYNATLLDVCRVRNVDCVDLASVFPKNRTVFYDDVHFTESGARLVADVLFTHMVPLTPGVSTEAGS